MCRYFIFSSREGTFSDQRIYKNKVTLQELGLAAFTFSCKGRQGVIYRPIKVVNELKLLVLMNMALRQNYY
jgi:hypothetical protein